jgi:Holliday junction resolvase
MKPLFVINSRGEKEPFSFQKLSRSAKRAGASEKAAREIADIVKKKVYPGIKTSEIFKEMKKLLKKEIPNAGLRFNLKEGMRKLGPTGFPFEKFIGEVLKRIGFEVELNQYISGRCLGKYEIDFVAKKGREIYIGECKYRNLFGERVHLDDALSNFARFLDILKNPSFKSKKARGFKIKSLLVTNTKFTSRALNYCRCVGVELLGWRSPKNRGLEYLIEKEKLYPVTILPSLRGRLRDILSSEKMMLAEDLLKINPQKFAKKFNISLEQFGLLIKEAQVLFEKEKLNISRPPNFGKKEKGLG